MRRVNAAVSVGIIVFLLIHGIAGSFQMMGMISGGSFVLKILTWIMFALIAVHTLTGIILTIHTLQISKKTGVSYVKENAFFWIRRISGFVLLLFVALHLAVFMQTGEEIFRLSCFGIPQLIGQVLMLSALALHLLCNIKPLSIALGLYGGNGYGRDILLILSVVLAFCASAFVVYYLRWNVFWR